MRNIILVYTAILTLAFSISNNANAALATNAVLAFDDGLLVCEAGGVAPDACTDGLTNVAMGSYVGLDFDTNLIIENAERIAITRSGLGITLGSTQSPGDIDEAWDLGGTLSNHYSSTSPNVTSTTVNTATIDMSGWKVQWGLTDLISDSATENTIATVTCDIDCAIGDRFVLDYYISDIQLAFVGTVAYTLHLEGVIAAAPIPVPGAIWLLGSGLLALMGFSRRRNR